MGDYDVDYENNEPTKNKFLVTVVTTENDKEYYLYSDGKLYEKDEKGEMKVLDNVTPESKELIKKIMDRFKPGRTDVIRGESTPKNTRKIIKVDPPEL